MEIDQSPAAHGQRRAASLSADNRDVMPERHRIIDTLRRAADSLQLRPPVIATLEVLLSCLAPRRRHHVVFASNETLVFRRSGISERTLRRHICALEAAGLLLRADSANRKRFTRRDPQSGEMLRFGFDLAPLFSRLPEIETAARASEDQAAAVRFARTRLRAAITRALLQDMADPDALAARAALRRKTDLATLQELAAGLPQITSTPADLEPQQMSGKDGQNVRHQHSSIIEEQGNHNTEVELKVTTLVALCPDAAAFAEKIETQTDVLRHAQRLAPMLGIDDASYLQAARNLGSMGAALTVWGMVERAGQIAVPGAYFRALSTGRRSAGFDPSAFVRSLGSPVRNERGRAVVRGQHAC